MKIKWKYQPKLPFAGWALIVRLDSKEHAITVRTLFSTWGRRDKPPPYQWVLPVAYQLVATARAAAAISDTF